MLWSVLLNVHYVASCVEGVLRSLLGLGLLVTSAAKPIMYVCTSISKRQASPPRSVVAARLRAVKLVGLRVQRNWPPQIPGAKQRSDSALWLRSIDCRCSSLPLHQLVAPVVACLCYSRRPIRDRFWRHWRPFLSLFAVGIRICRLSYCWLAGFSQFSPSLAPLTNTAGDLFDGPGEN